MPFVNHYRVGVDQIRHKGKVTLTSSSNLEANAFILNLDTIDVQVAYVKNGFEHRPDLISELFYDTPTYDWLIMLLNNIDDPFEGFNINDRIFLPISV